MLPRLQLWKIPKYCGYFTNSRAICHSLQGAEQWLKYSGQREYPPNHFSQYSRKSRSNSVDLLYWWFICVPST